MLRVIRDIRDQGRCLATDFQIGANQYDAGQGGVHQAQVMAVRGLAVEHQVLLALDQTCDQRMIQRLDIFVCRGGNGAHGLFSGVSRALRLGSRRDALGSSCLSTRDVGQAVASMVPSHRETLS
ncbi:hypothetical protein CER19_06580 [Pseudomonas sp. GL93]|nr:hypothetical protein CER19_06580 [Pseudomonas sp. GL93]